MLLNSVHRLTSRHHTIMLSPAGSESLLSKPWKLARSVEPLQRGLLCAAGVKHKGCVWRLEGTAIRPHVPILRHSCLELAFRVSYLGTVEGAVCRHTEVGLRYLDT